MAKSDRIVDDTPAPAQPLRLFTCTDHDTLNAGNRAASYIQAYDEAHARILLDKALEKAALRPYRMYRYQLQEIPTDTPMAEVLNDGDY